MTTPPAIEHFLTVTLGMAKDAVGKSALSRAIASTMRGEGVSEPAVYEKLIASSGDARQRLIDAVVVGETWFFRDRGPFTCLARHARSLHHKKTGDVLNILSAPCSTGEEPYSIVMTLLTAGLHPAAFTVEGVDISATALEKARKAIYGSGSFRGHIGDDVAHFFETTPSGRRVVKPVVRKVSFFQENLVSPGHPAERGPYAVIFCRNLLIYLTPDARRRVFEQLDNLLAPGGIVFAGHTETVFWHQQGYVPLEGDRAFALVKPILPAAPKRVKATMTAKATTKPATSGRDISAPAIGGALAGGAIRTPAAAGNKIERHQASPDPLPAEVKPFIEGQLQEARRMADQGDMENALRHCRECNKKSGPTAEVYGLMGVIHMAKKDFGGAEDFFLKALYLDPGHYESLVHISLLYGRKGDARKAALYRKRAERRADAAGMPEKQADTETDGNIRINNG